MIIKSLYIGVVSIYSSIYMHSFDLSNFLSPIFSSNKNITNLTWVAKGYTPDYMNKFKPQGLTIVNKKIIFSYHMNDKGSRIFQINPNTMIIEKSFDMPIEAIHTSGLTYDGEFLWATDYKSNYIYQIDIGSSFKMKKANVINKFYTTLKGTSACTFLIFQGQSYIAVSDFMNSESIYLMNIKNSLKENKFVYDFSFKNAGFSQGLAWDGKYIYDSSGVWGKDRIYKIDLSKAIQYKNFKNAIISIFNAPDSMVEDIEFDGNTLWTSDESTFMFYKANLGDLK